jgi:hypothetical protein
MEAYFLPLSQLQPVYSISSHFRVKTMEGSHEPQLPVVSPPAAQPALPIQPVSAAPPARRPGRFLMFRRAIRLLFRRWLYAMAIVFRWIRPVAGFAAVIIALLGVIGWMAALLWWPSGGAPKDVRVAPLPPASAVETFLQGQQTYNAELMWQAYSPDYQAAQLQRGATKAVLQAQADSQRRRGLQYVHSDYIGGVKLDDGRSMYFYTVDLALESQHAKFPYIFTADPEGKIVDIDSPFTRQQSSGQ